MKSGSTNLVINKTSGPNNIFDILYVCINVVDAIDPLLDSEPVDVHKLLKGSIAERFSNLKALSVLAQTGTKMESNRFKYLIRNKMIVRESWWKRNFSLFAGLRLGDEIPNFYELLTAPASKISF